MLFPKNNKGILSLEQAYTINTWNKQDNIVLAFGRKKDVLNLIIFFIFIDFPTQVIQKIQRYSEERGLTLRFFSGSIHTTSK